MKQCANERAGAGATVRDSHRVAACTWDVGPVDSHVSQLIPPNPV